ncbi:multidrug resistance protein 1, 2, 3 [Pseudozyma hubeiensis SY62]|uniref:Multidrug resistance protein 1, 2, 3 n=1 Tax=Pseudozyma hubeiensis (strain SY62) TaxID=1305764 RepID=R9PCA5_PSEHS|nr:multidrug resistance protein 1, 2, 3 [Pseudozyma hubeiensis SY62]GAC95710.1 multidrug resistance protein 1, 2, 3 [Pseudozyma hubeiensis SY62]
MGTLMPSEIIYRGKSTANKGSASRANKKDKKVTEHRLIRIDSDSCHTFVTELSLSRITPIPPFRSLDITSEKTRIIGTTQSYLATFPDAAIIDTMIDQQQQQSQQAQQAPAMQALHKAGARAVARLPFEAHRTRLPTLLYLFSFCPAIPSPFQSPHAFLRHPGVLYAIGFVAALLAGCGMPALDLLYGVYTNRVTPGSASPQTIRDTSSYIGWICTIVGFSEFFLAWLFLACFSTASHDLTQRLRHTYVASVLAQDASHFDLHGAGEIANRASKDISVIRAGFGEKLGYFCWSGATLLVAVIIGFIKSPRVAGVLFALLPLTMIIFAILGKATEAVGAPALRLEARASTFLEQVLGSVRVVQSFGMDAQLQRHFDKLMLKPLEKLGMRKSAIRGLETSAVYFMLNLTYSLAFWWGAINIAEGKVLVGDVLTTFWNYFNSLFSLANIVPHIASIFDAWTALKQVRRAIEREPKIDIRQETGTIPTSDAKDWSPSFELDHVTFSYPSRPNVASLKQVSILFEPGKVTALVGPSGSGKSTITSLLLREYDPETANIPHPHDAEDEQAAKEDKEAEADNDPAEKHTKDKAKNKGLSFLTRSRSSKDSPISQDAETSDPAADVKGRIQGSGTVRFAGHDVRELNTRWLRSQIAIVQQHPQLFTASVFENVATGLTGTEWEYLPDVDGDASAPGHDAARTAAIRDKVMCALQKAEAWHFVSKLPQGMDTPVSGGRTGLLSGGQRQRVAIARALVREPRLLCLDEGTSALDSDTESKIKLALQREQEERGMTTILIAHRLSTIEHADSIVVLKNGRVVEQGTHDSLMQSKAAAEGGVYRSMVMQQRHLADYEASSEDNDSDVNKLAKLADVDAKPASKSSGESLDALSSDSAEPLDELQERDRSRSMYALSDDTMTRVDGASTVRSASVVPERLEPRHDARPTMAPRPHRSSRASDKPYRTFSGRTGTALGLHEHAQEATVGVNDAQLALPAGTAAGVLPAKADPKDADSPAGRKESDNRSKAARKEEKRRLRKTFFRYLNDQKLWFAIGVAGAALTGGSFPIAGWLTGNAVNSLSIEGDNARLKSETNRWALWFLTLALADLVIVLVGSFFLETASEHVMRKLKKEGLSSLIRQEIGFFDAEEHASGAMSAAVSSHPANVAAATGLVLAQVVIGIVNLIGSVILGLVLSWKTSVVCLAPIFVLFFSGWLNIAMLEKYEAVAQKPADRAASYVSENVDAIKTVAALGREAETMRIFDERARADPKRTRYLVFGAGGFAASQAMVLLLSALVFYWGGTLLSRQEVSITALYASFEAVIIAAFSAGRLFTFVPDYGRATNSFKTISGWINRKPLVADQSGLPELDKAAKAKVLDGSYASGDITLTSIELRYPQRPNHPALKELSITIPAGKSVAFCGTSGSGKSSILALLQRFYDPCQGNIEFGGVDVRQVPIHLLRQQMAYVSQDPILYEGTIRWNLSLGSNDPDSVTQEQLERACEDAYILDFVRGLPNGFDTEIGFKGSQLSGGQKQRLCIARALLRDPKILLLDEATSALDAESEIQVQRALDRAALNRTTVTIAHRLSSLRKCDWIFVVEDGNIRESGTHADLIARGGRYRELMEQQL